jgi:sigma-B regulation protein RsbU (phosphoserine phosphatase)
MTAATTRAVDYRELMKKVEHLVDAIERADDIEATIRTVIEGIIAQFRDELGIYGGRVYRRQGSDYVLRGTFGEAKPVEPGLRVPRAYPPIDQCLQEGAVFMASDAPGVDTAFERELGVKEFACVEVGDEVYILAFNVAPSADREDVVFSLQILRHAINQKIRQERMVEVFREARKIQASILPRKMPSYPPFELAGRIEPMESVGGDFYDLIPITDKILGVAIADVSGHGLPAALQTRDIHMGLRMGMARDFKIVRTVERLNEIIHQSTLTSRFVALFYGELEENGTFIYVNAGHIAPVHLEAGGGFRLLEEGGPVLGPLPDTAYERGVVHVGPGDVLLFYTDGIVEAENDRGEELGLERILDLVRDHREEPAADIVERIFDEVERFTGAAPPEDDRTVIVVRRPR